MALNTYRVVFNNQKVGCGGVVIDHNGNWIHGFKKNIGRCSVMTTELWDILEEIRCSTTSITGEICSFKRNRKRLTILLRWTIKGRTMDYRWCDIFNRN